MVAFASWEDRLAQFTKREKDAAEAARIRMRRVGNPSLADALRMTATIKTAQSQQMTVGELCTFMAQVWRGFVAIQPNPIRK